MPTDTPLQCPQCAALGPTAGCTDCPRSGGAPGPRAAAPTAPTEAELRAEVEAIMVRHGAVQFCWRRYHAMNGLEPCAGCLADARELLLAGRAPAPTEEDEKDAQLEDDATRLDWLHRRLGGLPTSVSEALFGYWDWMDVREAIDRAMQEDL